MEMKWNRQEIKDWSEVGGNLWLLLIFHQQTRKEIFRVWSLKKYELLKILRFVLEFNLI